jgi:anti-anti-sigma factor
MTNERIISAPANLDAKTRIPFRDAALAALEELGEGGGRLVIDLAATRRLDSAALGMLVMLQLRASERRLAICLRNVSEEVRFLLLMTRLEERFEIEPASKA